MCWVGTLPPRVVPVGNADSITAANEANAAKDKALAEASALKLAAEREHAAFEEEWRQLTHLIEDDRCRRCWPALSPHALVSDADTES